MASAFAHALAAMTVGKALNLKERPSGFWSMGIICAILPDIDVLAFAVGIPYGHVLGHRGFTHSIVFAALVALLLCRLFFRRIAPGSPQWFGQVFYLFICTASHGLLDAMTNGGLGIAFFSPFDNARYFLPWQPIQVSPIGVAAFFSEWGLQVISSEFIWVGLPCLALLILFKLFGAVIPK